MSIGDLVPDDWTQIRETPWGFGFRDHAGAGDIDTGLQDDGEDYVPLDWQAVQKLALDKAFDDGYRCGVDISRCERRELREQRDAKKETRSFIVQVSLLVTIVVVVMCSTVLLIHG